MISKKYLKPSNRTVVITMPEAKNAEAGAKQ